MAQEQAKQSARAITMRYYENELPQLNELVLVKFTQLTDNSAYVELLEYANIQGMITFSELHRGRITSISHYASIGKEDIMVVIRLDPVKKYIDLSKRTLKAEDREAGHAKAQAGKDVLNYMCTIADSCDVPLPDMMEKVAWPLYRKYEAQGGALGALKAAVSRSEEVLGPLDIPGGKKVRSALDKLVQNKLKPKVRKYECEISVTCNTVKGVEAIKEVLEAGAKSTGGKVVVTVKASPHFLLRTQNFDREEALRTLHTCVQVIKDHAASLQVVVEIDKEPCDVSDVVPQGGAAAAAKS